MCIDLFLIWVTVGTSLKRFSLRRGFLLYFKCINTKIDLMDEKKKIPIEKCVEIEFFSYGDGEK